MPDNADCGTFHFAAGAQAPGKWVGVALLFAWRRTRRCSGPRAKVLVCQGLECQRLPLPLSFGVRRHKSFEARMHQPDIESFPADVARKLETYVYRLIDPRNGETFYIGKGPGQPRLFAHSRRAEFGRG